MAVMEQTSQSPLLPQSQIHYGIPYQEPPTTYILLHAYRRRRNLRRCCPSLLSSSSLLLLSLSLLLLLAALFFLYPSDPQISLSRLRLKHLRIKTLPFPSLTISLGLKVRVRNPDFFSLRYSSLVASIGYRGRRLGVVESSGGRIRARGVSYVDAELELDGIEIIGDVFYLIEDIARGVVPLETVTELDGTLRLFFIDVPVQKALKAYHACGNWRGVLTVAGILRLGKAEVVQLANELCEELQALGKSAEAAKIALEYCDDVARGVGYYIMAREWDEALRVGYMHEREDLVSDVKDAALECAVTLVSEYKEGSEKIGKYLARYLAVRQRRILLAAKLQSEERFMDDAGFDTASEVSSTFSDMSAYTTRTTKESGASVSSTTASKARDMRRQRKKGGKIRAGSPGEEIGLVEHLKGMSLTDSALRELKSLVATLLMLGKDDIARQLQGVADTFQLSQQAAAILAEDTMSNETIDENTQTLEHYLKKLRGTPHLRNLSWQSKVLLPR